MGLGGTRVSAANVTVTASSNQMVINEVTDFSSVNSGLLSLTQDVAENDVFKYTVSNNGAGLSGSTVTTPVYDTYIRTNRGLSTTLTGRELAYDNTTTLDTTGIYLDCSRQLSGGDYWNTSATIVAWAWIGSNSGRVYRGTADAMLQNGNTASRIIRFSTIPSNITGIQFFRF